MSSSLNGGGGGDDDGVQRRAATLMLVQKLSEMGFPQEHAEKSVKHVDVLHRFAMDLCIQWMDDNPLGDASAFRAQHSEEVEALTKMGFSTEEAIDGLRFQDGAGIHRAVVCILVRKLHDVHGQIREARVTLAHLGEALEPYDPQGDEDVMQMPPVKANADADKKVCKRRIVVLQQAVLTQQRTLIELKMKLEEVGGAPPPEFRSSMDDMPPPPPAPPDDDDDDYDEVGDNVDDEGPRDWRRGRRQSDAPPPPPLDLEDIPPPMDDDGDSTPELSPDSPTSVLGFRPPPPASDDDVDYDNNSFVESPPEAPDAPPTQQPSPVVRRRRLRTEALPEAPKPPKSLSLDVTQKQRPRRSASLMSPSSSALSPRSAMLQRQRTSTDDMMAKSNNNSSSSSGGMKTGRSRMLELLDAKKSKKSGTSDSSTEVQKYESVHIEIADVLELAAKLGKSFRVVCGCGTVRYKTGHLQSSVLKESWRPTVFQFNLTRASTNIVIRIHDMDENAYIGGLKLDMDNLSKPMDTQWYKLDTVRPSLYAKLRSRAQKTTEMQVRVRFRLGQAGPVDPSYTRIQRHAEKSDTSAIADALRARASGNTVRFHEDGFDLDLTYITDNIIAMGFPASGAEAVYRNRMKDVQRFFNLYHKDHYRVYNLCADKKYQSTKLGQRVVEIDIDQHRPPTFANLMLFCRDADKWLKAHKRNVIGVHGLSGRHRTGCMIACLMVYRKLHDRSSKAIHHFNDKRTTDGQGLVLPSQLRYVRYWTRYVTGKMGVNSDRDLIDDPLLASVRAKQPPTILLQRLTLCGVPSIAQGSKIWFNITQPSVRNYKFSSRKTIQEKNYAPSTKVWYVPRHVPIALQEDVRVTFFSGTTFRKKELMMLAFNTRFVPMQKVVEPGENAPRLKLRIKMPKWGIDQAASDTDNKVYPEDMWVELTFVRSQA